MSLSTEASVKQVVRLCAMGNYPKHPEGEAELVRALQRNCSSPEHARATVDQAIEGGRFCPTPFDLAEIARQLTEACDSPEVTEHNCATCCGSGWRVDLYLVTYCGPRKSWQRITEEQRRDLEPKISGRPSDQIITTAARLCECAEGRRIARAKAEWEAAHPSRTAGRRQSKPTTAGDVLPGIRSDIGTGAVI